MTRLIVATGSAGHVTHELTEEIVTVGRAPENAIVLDDPSVSARHGELRLEGAAYHLHDLGSAGGTRVNGGLINEAMLRTGDRIRFGVVEARFEASEPETQPSVAASENEFQAAATSARPSDFVNASPFRTRKKQRDPVRTAIFIGAGIALLALLVGIAAVMQMQAP